MNSLTVFGACASAVMLIAYSFEERSRWWVLVFAVACAASSAYGWLALWHGGGRLGCGRHQAMVAPTDGDAARVGGAGTISQER